jgi:hypothetical protein
VVSPQLSVLRNLLTTEDRRLTTNSRLPLFA